MGVRKIKEKKYKVKLYYVTWHAACEHVYKHGESIQYSDLDGDDVYFRQLNEYLEAGWEIMKVGDMNITMTGDIYPIEDHLKNLRVRKALKQYIQFYTRNRKILYWDQPRICGREDKIVPYGYIVDSKKLDKIVEKVLKDLAKRPMKDFVRKL